MGPEPEYPADSSQPADAQPVNEVYDQLRGLAARYLRGQRQSHTLQPTALVHEAFVRLIRQPSHSEVKGTDLIRLAASAMRSVLVDHARRRSARKRSSDGHRLPIDDLDVTLADAPDLDDLVAIDQAMDKLAALEPQWRLIVELRFFGGCSEEETAKLLNVSPRTVQRQWRMAKAWLRNEIRQTESP